jgi:hypothetical protein
MLGFFITNLYQALANLLPEKALAIQTDININAKLTESAG